MPGKEFNWNLILHSSIGRSCLLLCSSAPAELPVAQEAQMRSSLLSQPSPGNHEISVLVVQQMEAQSLALSWDPRWTKQKQAKARHKSRSGSEKAAACCCCYRVGLNPSMEPNNNNRSSCRDINHDKTSPSTDTCWWRILLAAFGGFLEFKSDSFVPWFTSSSVQKWRNSFKCAMQSVRKHVRREWGSLQVSPISLVFQVNFCSRSSSLKLDRAFIIWRVVADLLTV